VAGHADRAVLTDLSVAVEGVSGFGFDLYGSLAGESGNVLLSPVNLAQVLAVLEQGAVGQTADEIASVLHDGLPAETFQDALGQLYGEIAGDGPAGVTLAIATSLWLQAGERFHPAFVDLVLRRHNAQAITTDFRTDPASARRRVNAWAAEKTNDRIRELLAEGQPDPETSLLVAAAIFLHAPWETAFPRDQTDTAPFHAPSRTMAVVMMHRQASLPYVEEETLQAVELPYAGGELAMLVVLPRSGALGATEKRLHGAALARLVADLSPRTVEIGVPRFSFSWGGRLTAPLSGLGMGRAFTPEAEFARMAPTRLYVHDLVQRARIEVDEEGTTAAAAAAVEMAPFSTFMPTIVCDRPFLFFVRHRPTGALLFLGRVVDPAG
jgi:serpin B